MQLNIHLDGEELNSRRAAKQLHLLADLVKSGVMHAEGFSAETMGEFVLDVDMGDVWPHGDYQDARGNLLHIADDTVVNVTWASKGAEQEEVDVPVGEWIEQYGPVTPAGHGHSHGPDDEEGHHHG